MTADSNKGIEKEENGSKDLFDDQSRSIPIFGIYLIVLNVILISSLLFIWPEQGFHQSYKAGIGLDLLYLMIVVLCGGLGSSIYLCTSFADYVGNNKFKISWGVWYILRPFIGMSLAVIAYFVLRGGFIGVGGGADSLNPYGIAAMAALVGMFSRQATDKLREVFDNIFSTNTPIKRKDGLGNRKKGDIIKGVVEEIVSGELLRIRIIEEEEDNKYEYDEEEIIFIANKVESGLAAPEGQDQKEYLEQSIKTKNIICHIQTRNADKQLVSTVKVC